MRQKTELEHQMEKREDRQSWSYFVFEFNTDPILRYQSGVKDTLWGCVSVWRHSGRPLAPNTVCLSVCMCVSHGGRETQLLHFYRTVKSMQSGFEWKKYTLLSSNKYVCTCLCRKQLVVIGHRPPLAITALASLLWTLTIILLLLQSCAEKSGRDRKQNSHMQKSYVLQKTKD